MPLSSKILRGLDVKGWKLYQPRVEEPPAGELPQEGQPGEEAGPGPEPPLLTREDIENERARALDSARQEAEKLRLEALEKAQKEAEALQEKARREGYQEGYSSGRAEAEELKQKAAAVVEEARAHHRQILDGAEPQIVSIALALAHKILGYAVEMDREAVIAVISRALESLPGGQEVTLRVNPADEEACRESLLQLEGLLKRGAYLEIAPDEEIPRGSCRVESEAAEVEIIVQKELETLGRMLLETASGRGQDEIDS